MILGLENAHLDRRRLTRDTRQRDDSGPQATPPSTQANPMDTTTLNKGVDIPADIAATS
jgi:hypothetical protein